MREEVSLSKMQSMGCEERIVLARFKNGMQEEVSFSQIQQWNAEEGVSFRQRIGKGYRILAGTLFFCLKGEFNNFHQGSWRVTNAILVLFVTIFFSII